MAELLLGAFVTVLIEKLASGSSHYLRDFIRSVGVHKLLEEWSTKLERYRDVLEDAEEKQHTNREVRRWLDDLHDLVYDVDDFVDELATEAQARRINRSRASTSRFPNCISAVSLINNCGINPAAFKFNHKMKRKVDDISRRLQDISQRRGTLGLIQSNISGPQTVVTMSTQLPTTTSLPPSRVIGREKEKKEIVDMLLKPGAEAAEITVITILGMGGMGKTTLAQDVYNDKEVQGSFDLRAWVCVSDVFDVTNITRAILKEIPGADNTEKLKLNQLQVKLMEMLSGKKFLLVLDDIWNENYGDWERLLRPFPSGAAAAGSRILATSRNESVASTMSLTGPRYHLKELGEGDCLSLLASHALDRKDFAEHLHLKESGEKIVKKCGHLPLAIKMVAGLLHNKRQLQCEWEAVINSNKWTEGSYGILPALRVSYYHLPSHLKRCFAYCSIIPKDYIFDKNDLVLLWMAEGLLEQPAGGMEDFGRDCFQELLSRSFFQLTGKSESEFIMHDLINDFAVHIAGERCFRMDDAWDENGKYEISERTRHLSFISQNYEVSKKFDIFNTARRSRIFLALPPNMCSIFLFGPTFNISNTILALMLSRLPSLRVLNLRYYCIAELPNPVGSLKHLRYLNLSYTRVAQLPPFVCSLYNLQTLSLNSCESLHELPSRIGCLTNLRHLGLIDTPKLKKMPTGIRKLTSLQTLSKIIVGRDKGSCNLKDLKDLRHLHGTLSIKELHNVTNDQDAVDADLRFKEHLEVLKLQWQCFGDSADSFHDTLLEKRVLEKLQPHCNLEVLEIEGYGGIEFPSWVRGQSLPRLLVLKIGHCRELEKLPKGLHGLASLQEMSISYCPSLVWDATDRLPESLIKLKLINCGKSVLSNWGFHRLTSLQTLEMWGFEDVVSFEQVVGDSNGGVASTSTSYFFPPSLTKLFISEFPNLESLSNSLQNLTSLRELQISRCPKLESLAGAGDDEASLQIIRSLHKLNIFSCSEVLIEHCKKEKCKY